MSEFNISGDQCIGQMNGGSVYNIVTNNALNKLPFVFAEDGQLFYSFRYPYIRYGFKKSILYYYTVFLLLMVITSIFSINPPKDLFFLFVFTLPLASYFVYHNLKQSNKLFANRIELNSKKTIIDFKNIRKLKRAQLNVKIYFKQELYPKYVLGLKNEDQVDLVMESYENWLENHSNKKIKASNPPLTNHTHHLK